MATLTELQEIYTNSLTVLSDPPTEPQDVQDAVALRGKVFMAVQIVARTLLEGGTIQSGAYPSSPQETNEALAWASRALRGSAQVADQALLAALAGGSAFTPAQILGSSDAALQSGIEDLFPGIARGLHPGR